MAGWIKHPEKGFYVSVDKLTEFSDVECSDAPRVRYWLVGDNRETGGHEIAGVTAADFAAAVIEATRAGDGAVVAFRLSA